MSVIATNSGNSLIPCWGCVPSSSAKSEGSWSQSDRLFLVSGSGQACLYDVRDRKQPVGPYRAYSCLHMLCRAPRRAVRDAASGGIPEDEGSAVGLILYHREDEGSCVRYYPPNRFADSNPLTYLCHRYWIAPLEKGQKTYIEHFSLAGECSTF